MAEEKLVREKVNHEMAEEMKETQNEVNEEKANQKEANQEDMNLEQLFEQLEEIINRMEQGDASLEDSFRMYHQGMDLLKQCNDKIDKVEKKMLILDEEGETHDFEQ